MSTLKIATRGSELALWQARFVQSQLKKIGLESELKILKTQGDKIQHLSLEKLEGKGFFTKEIEDALLNGEADIAVHSHKDLPTDITPGLIIAAVSNREDPSELLLIRKDSDDKQRFGLKKNAIVGTSSARRKSQLLNYRSDIQLKDLRGNVPTRINKLREGQYDAILLAAAGVERLQLNTDDLIVLKLDPKEFIPAPAQGVLAIQIREKDRDLFDQLQALNNTSVAVTTNIERKVMNLFEGGCHVPVGAYAEYDDEKEVFRLWVSKAESAETVPAAVYIESRQPLTMAERAVEKLRGFKPTSVFITRNLKPSDYFLKTLTAHGYKVEGEALIDINQVRFNAKKVDDAEWIFFSSKNAVRYFFQQKPELSEQRIGCIGKSTAEEIRKYGKRAEFIGYSTDTKLTGKQFASRVGRSKVLFPMAKGSLRSVQEGFVKPEQVIDLVVYETKERSSIVPESEIIVFTSPSNTDAYFRANTMSKGQKAIAMGEATAHALKKHGVNAAALPDMFTDAGLVRAVVGIS